MRRSIISLVVGIAFAVAAIWVLFSMRTPAREADAGVPVMQTSPILVATKDIAYGQRITGEYVEEVRWPTAYVPKDALVAKTDLLDGPDAPRIAMRAFAAGEPFLKAKVSGFGERPILSRKVAEGMRAFSVRINDISGVSGFILPGDHVDIMVTRQVEGSGSSGYATDVILQNIAVLGIDQVTDEDQNKPVVGKSATFEVTPEQAQKLALAMQVGTLTLALRNYETVRTEETKRIDGGDLGERKAPAPVAKAPVAPKPDTSVYVQVRKGTQVSSEKVTH